VSNWLFLTVFIVALFLAAGKRQGELISSVTMPGNIERACPTTARRSLRACSGSARQRPLVTYTLYTIENNSKMFYTFPVAIYGFIRYIYVGQERQGRSHGGVAEGPADVPDRAAWALVVAAAIYG